MGLNGAGKTTLLRILAGETERRRGHVHGSATASQPGYYAQEHEGIARRRRRADAHAGGVAARTTRRCASLLGMFGLPGEMAFQDAGTLSGGEKTKLALAQLVAGRKTSCCSTSPRTTSIRRRGRRSPRRSQDWPGAMVIVSHDTEFVEALEPERVLMMPDGDLDYWSDDLLDLVALA